MSLRRIDLPTGDQLPYTIPTRVEELLVDAHARIDEFIFQRQRMIHDFVASDFQSVYRMLLWIHDRQLLTGGAFCEWGCGFGVVAMLAAETGMNAFGLEVEPELVDEAVQLAADYDIEATFGVGSLVPSGGDDLLADVGDVAHLDLSTASGYDELGMEIDDFDLIFAFPWPGEEGFLEDLFDHYAADGAMLMTYHGLEDLRLQCKHRS